MVTNYVNLCAYQVPGERVLLVLGESEQDIALPEDAQEDPDAFEAFILELARTHGITYVMDIDGEFVSIPDWTQHGV